jgi:hypothetical protein
MMPLPPSTGIEVTGIEVTRMDSHCLPLRECRELLEVLVKQGPKHEWFLSTVMAYFKETEMPIDGAQATRALTTALAIEHELQEFTDVEAYQYTMQSLRDTLPLKVSRRLKQTLRTLIFPILVSHPLFP